MSAPLYQSSTLHVCKQSWTGAALASLRWCEMTVHDQWCLKGDCLQCRLSMNLHPVCQLLFRLLAKSQPSTKITVLTSVHSLEHFALKSAGHASMEREMQLSAQLEAHFQAYDAQIKQACAKLKVVWGSLELSVDEQAGELTKASQKALDVWSAACTEAERRICAVESSIEDMRREITKTKDLLKLNEARTALEPQRTVGHINT